MAPSPSDDASFETPRRVAAIMAGFRQPWYLAGGWALDVWLGRFTRPHEDIEIAIVREDQEEVRRHLTEWTFEKVVRSTEGHRREPWREGERLDLPTHELHARRSKGKLREIEVLLNESDGERWRFRRDLRIARPLAQIWISVAGLPILVPEIVLLYKAKAPRARDEEDFQNALKALSPSQREWLRTALETVHPGHPWARAL